jgi:hypothetical protein
MSDARARQSEVELRPIDPPVVAALDALRAGDLDGFSDWLHDARFPSTAIAVAALRSLAESIVGEGLDAGLAPSATVDEITATFVGRCGLSTAVAAMAPGAPPRVAGFGIDADADADPHRAALRRELAAARDEIVRLRAERDALETRVDELAGARVLADALAAELERDEWIRARLRHLKQTRGARALIYARRRLLSRTSSPASR